MLPGTNILTLPGLSGSGPEHWQSRWERRHGFRRVEQADWENPRLADWADRLEAALAESDQPCVLVAHSLACALIAHVAGRMPGARIAAALLVAPADIDDPARTPPETRDFAPMPLAPLPFDATVIASRDDPYVSFERAAHFAHCWRARLIDAGPAGHINASSGLADWPAGLEQLRALGQRVR